MTKKILITNKEGKYEWQEVDIASNFKGTDRLMPINGYDPTINQYINDKGGIRSPVDNKVYTSERSYKEHLKNSGRHIVDY